MSRIRSLLVHIDGGTRCSARLEIAADLAEREQATLTALFAATPPLLDLPYAHVGGAIAVDGLQELFGRRLNAARRLVESLSTQRRLACAWAEVAGVPPTAGFAQQALYADLLLLGQHDAGDPAAQHVPADFVHGVLMQSGKPALIVPNAGAPRGAGRTAVVAWNATRESARALTAALPLLRDAQQVHVFSWGEDGATGRGQALDVGGFLRLHGIEAALHRERRMPRELGETLLSLAADLGADLLVMGCYGHSRAREAVLGGVSRTVLASMTLPVLMCH